MKGLENQNCCNDCTNCCFSGITSTPDLALLNENSTIINYYKDEVLLKQNAYVSSIYYLKQGLVKQVIESRNNKNTIVNILPSNSFITMPILHSEIRFPLSIVALNDCVVCQIRKETFHEIFKRGTNAREFIHKWHNNTYNALYEKISVLSTRNNHGKIAYVLSQLKEIEKTSPDVFLYISRKELSEMASISLESTNKILAELKHDGIIDIKNQKVSILQPELIERLSTLG